MGFARAQPILRPTDGRRGIERDRVEDDAKLKGWTADEAEKWLAPILTYDPARAMQEAAA